MPFNQIMETGIDQCRRILQNSVAECESKWIALSGGLDSSILAHLLKDQKTTSDNHHYKGFFGDRSHLCTDHLPNTQDCLFH